MIPGNAPVVILKEGTKRDSGRRATQNNIAAFLTDSKGDLVEQIKTQGAETDDVESALKSALDEFKSQS